MNALRKIWVRVLLSLLGSGMASEIVRIIYDIVLPSVLFFIVAIVLFVILTGIILIDKYRHYYFPKKTEDSDELNDKELLSNFEKRNNTE